MTIGNDAHDNNKVYRVCKVCGIERNVSATTTYDEDNYTCHVCSAELKRNVKIAQPTANRIERTTK